MCPCNHDTRKIFFFFFLTRTAFAFFPPHKTLKNPEDTRGILRVRVRVMTIVQSGRGIKGGNVPFSMLFPLLRRSRRHLVASIHPGSLSLPLSASCAVIGQRTRSLSSSTHQGAAASPLVAADRRSCGLHRISPYNDAGRKSPTVHCGCLCSSSYMHQLFLLFTDMYT